MRRTVADLDTLSPRRDGSDAFAASPCYVATRASIRRESDLGGLPGRWQDVERRRRVRQRWRNGFPLLLTCMSPICPGAAGTAPRSDHAWPADVLMLAARDDYTPAETSLSTMQAA